MGERREFPASQVPSQEKHAFTPGKRALVILEAVIDDNIGDILTRVTGKEAELSELASQRNVFTAKNPAPVTKRHFGKGDLQVAHPDAAQAPMKEIDKQPESNPFGSREWTGKQANRFHPEPESPVFKAFTHCAGV
jgi:hypothetical protein